MSLFRNALIAAIAISLIFYGTHYFETPANNCQVAVLLPAVHPSMTQIEQGFSKTLQEKMPHVSIKIYNANGDKVLMKGQVEKIVDSNYDLIFTVGTTASQLTKTVLTKKMKHTPLVFAAIANPEKRGVINPDNRSEQITGVTESYDYNDQIDLLLKVKPDTKRVMIVYDPSSNPALEELKQLLIDVLKMRNITTTDLAIFNAKELQQKLPTFLSTVDVVLTLTDHTICSAMDSIVKLCSNAHVTLFTSELDSNAKGAALSYGVNEAEYGKEGALKAYAILHEGKKTSDVPVTGLKDFFLLINTDTAKAQNVTIDPAFFTSTHIKITGKSTS